MKNSTFYIYIGFMLVTGCDKDGGSKKEAKEFEEAKIKWETTPPRLQLSFPERMFLSQSGRT